MRVLEIGFPVLSVLVRGTRIQSEDMILELIFVFICAAMLANKAKMPPWCAANTRNNICSINPVIFGSLWVHSFLDFTKLPKQQQTYNRQVWQVCVYSIILAAKPLRVR